ncbi:MAG: iron-sulfur cluster assembly protein [Caldilineaceae bacterium]
MFGRNNDNAGVTQEAVMQALGTVQEPELHNDLVSLNMIRDLTINGGTVGFTIMLTTPACPCAARWNRRAWPRSCRCPAWRR